MNSFLENRSAVGRADANVLTTSVSGSGFQPLFEPFSAQPTSAPQTPTIEPVQAEDGTKIEVIENGGKVERIIVTCSCCNRIELQCQY